jgi:hypothetical protein
MGAGDEFAREASSPGRIDVRACHPAGVRARHQLVDGPRVSGPVLIVNVHFLVVRPESPIAGDETPVDP